MPIVGFYIKSISAERKNIPKGRMDINSTPRVVSVENKKIGVTHEEDGLEVGFEFITRYEPKVAEIKMEGNVAYVGKKLKDAVKTWKNEKKLPTKIDMEIRNFLFRKCLTIGINMAEQMSLPPPLFFPRVVPKKESNENLRYIG